MSSILRSSAVHCLLIALSLALAGSAQAGIGKFWYGMYNVGHNYTDSTGYNPWPLLGDTLRMNWVLTDMQVVDELAGHLEDAKAAGINVMQWATREEGTPNDSAVIFYKYSTAAYLRVEADPDSIFYYWEPVPIYPTSACTLHVGTFARYRECNSILDPCSSCDACCGGEVIDALADNGKAYLFDATADSCADSIYTIFWMAIRKVYDRGYTFRFRVRVDTTSCSGSLLKLAVRKRTERFCISSDSLYVDLDTRELTCADFPDAGYQEFELTTAAGENDYLHAFVLWEGTTDVWVDWIEVFDTEGGELSEDNENALTLINGYIDKYTFDGDTGIIGFYMMEEWEGQDANVIPQKTVAWLIRDRSERLTPMTEVHTLFWWEQHNMFGGRVAASARVDSLSPVTGLFYPYTGYHFVETDASETPWAAGIMPLTDTVLGLDGTEDCYTTDTSTCLQERMDATAFTLLRFARVAEETEHDFTPFLQSFSCLYNKPPDSCFESREPNWKVAQREQTEGEAKLLASMALAYGADGLLYYVTGSHPDDYDTVIVSCRDGTKDTILNWHLKKDQHGLLGLPGVQQAMKNYIGPLVDSIGQLLYDL